MRRSASALHHALPFSATLLSCATLASSALLVSCATARSAPESDTSEAYVRLLSVDPPIGTDIDPSTPIRVRAAYRIPADADGYRASLMFVTESGGTASPRGARSTELTAETGIIEVSARAADVVTPLRAPLTAVVVVMAAPGEDVTDNLSAAMNARLQQMRDSLSRGDGTADVRVRVRAAPAVARSRAIFYNGAGPASGRIGPALPFDEALEEYRSYRGNKAFALATDGGGRQAWGYAFGFTLADSAIARAMRACESNAERRTLSAHCRVHSVGNVVIDP